MSVNDSPNMEINMDDLIETAVKRNASDAMRGTVAAMVDTQAAMITMLLEQGSITSLAAQQMINQLRGTKYPNPPLNGAEEVRRHFVKWTADHLQERVDWDRAPRR